MEINYYHQSSLFLCSGIGLYEQLVVVMAAKVTDRFQAALKKNALCVIVIFYQGSGDPTSAPK